MHDELRKKFWSLLNQYELLSTKKITIKNRIAIKDIRKNLSEVREQLEEIAKTGCFNETGHFWR